MPRRDIMEIGRRFNACINTINKNTHAVRYAMNLPS
jgi:hypothetical protein